MAKGEIDWPVIRAKFEQGISQRQLSREYGVAQPTISERAKNESWQRLSAFPIIEPITPSSEPINDSEDVDALATVQKALNDLAKHLENAPMDLKSHKLFADALSQYIKLKYMIPTDIETSAYDLRDLLSFCTDEERAIVKPIFAAATERKKIAQEKLLRKIG